MAAVSVLKNQNITRSQQWFDWSSQNLAPWRMLILLTLLTVKKFKLWNSKMAAANILKHRKITILKNRTTAISQQRFDLCHKIRHHDPRWPSLPTVTYSKFWKLTRVPCSNAAKTRNPLKLAGVPQTAEPISAASGPKFTILSGHVEEVLLFNKFFSDCRHILSCEDIARQSCAMVPRWRLFASCIFSEPHADLHLKFTLRPHHVWL